MKQVIVKVPVEEYTPNCDLIMIGLDEVGGRSRITVAPPEVPLDETRLQVGPIRLGRNSPIHPAALSRAAYDIARANVDSIVVIKVNGEEIAIASDENLREVMKRVSKSLRDSGHGRN